MRAHHTSDAGAQTQVALQTPLCAPCRTVIAKVATQINLSESRLSVLKSLKKRLELKGLCTAILVVIETAGDWRGITRNQRKQTIATTFGMQCHALKISLPRM